MEIFLLLLDELDDLAGALRMLWRPVAGFLTACALFAATGYGLLHTPLLVIGVAGTLLLGAFTMLAKREYERVLNAAADAKR